MTHNTPLTPRPLSELSDVRRRVVTVRTLRAWGVPLAEAQDRCRPGGPWQRPLPGVYLLHSGPASGEERLHAVLRYAQRDEPPGPAMVTGLAALALRGFDAAPRLAALERVDVLVPHTRRLRSTGWARVARARVMPVAEEAGGVPVAPVARAVADAVARLTDAVTVRRLLTEAVRGGHCEPQTLVRELTRTRALSRAHVVDAVDSLLAEGRALAEERLYAMVRDAGLPDPCWHVELRLPHGPPGCAVDAYWPGQGVAVELDARGTRRTGEDGGNLWAEHAHRRETLERLGITLLHLAPLRLRDDPHGQAAVVRTALMTAGERPPAAYVVVLPR
ncbi:hypothetical protein JJV70_03145 [Streptomyces sp. JJ66]|uniref:hypothetical protein n=1 Tax=Streptomyces sp. JJ66 TaxID=2803843 RepID=UPI001C5713E5|nr:hypothetical protein [Streptomyces sp. JJ66]MBW1601113.1 hypothetical protein [Streptomyces sp. JJ66]